MIAGIKTAAEARADAQAYAAAAAAPNSIGVKLLAVLHRLMEYQRNNPTALSATIPASENMLVPTAALASVTSTWGYVVTAVTAQKPEGYTGLITQWSRITQVSW